MKPPAAGHAGGTGFGLKTFLLFAIPACLVTAAALAVARSLQLGYIDDAFISLRYAAHWAEGSGLAYNPGERVEGYTNFLMVALEALAIRAGADPLVVPWVIGMASLASLAGFLALFVHRHVLPGRPSISVLASAAVSANLAFMCWACSGMETMLYVLLLSLGVLLAATSAGKVTLLLSALSMVMAGMTRPDAVLLMPLAAAALLLGTRSWRLFGLYCGIIVSLFGSYFAARALYFGYLLPNTFYAKVGAGNILLAKRGLLYLLSFARSAPLLVALPLLSCLMSGRAPLWAKAALAAAVLQFAGVVYVGGDHFAMFRFIAPILPFLSLASLYPAAALVQRRGLRGRGGVAVALTLALLLATGATMGEGGKPDEPAEMNQLQYHLFGCRMAREWKEAGLWFRNNAPPGSSVSTIAIGAVGYFSGLHIIDPLGLVDPRIAHQDSQPGRGFSGHEKYDVDHVLSLRPTFILVVHYLTAEPVPYMSLPAMAWGEFNKELLRHPSLHRDYRYRSMEVGGKWMNCFVRKGFGDSP